VSAASEMSSSEVSEAQPPGCSRHEVSETVPIHDNQKLCVPCSFLNSEKLLAKLSLEHHATYTDLAISAQNGCPLCKIILKPHDCRWRGIPSHPPTPWDDTMKKVTCVARRSWSNPYIGQLLFSGPFRCRLAKGSWQVEEVCIDIRTTPGNLDSVF
jgi:hypothetical protein